MYIYFSKILRKRGRTRSTGEREVCDSSFSPQQTELSEGKEEEAEEKKGEME